MKLVQICTDIALSLAIMAGLSSCNPQESPLPASSPLVSNPGFEDGNRCPWGMNSPGACIMPYPWFCAQSTPDWYNWCDSVAGADMPLNWMGDFSPYLSMIGIFHRIPPQSNHLPEWIGTPLIKPVMPGCTAIVRLVLMPSPSRQWAGGFNVVVGDTVGIQPDPVSAWQSHSVAIVAPYRVDSLYIGGDWGTGRRVRFGGSNSSYTCFGWIGTESTGCL